MNENEYNEKSEKNNGEEEDYFPDNDEKVPEIAEPWWVSVEQPTFKRARTDVSDNGSYSDAEVNMNVATLGVFNRPFSFHFSGVYYDVLKEENPNIETSFRKFFLVDKISTYNQFQHKFVDRVKYIRFRLGSEMCHRVSEILSNGEMVNGIFVPYRIITFVRRPNLNYGRFGDDEFDEDAEDNYDDDEKGKWDIVGVDLSPYYRNIY